jgi:hypothetical protein
MKQKQREEIEELAESIASEIAYEENEAMCGVFAQHKDEVEALIAAHGDTAIRKILDGAFIEYDVEQPITPADLMQQLFTKPRAEKVR